MHLNEKLGPVAAQANEAQKEGQLGTSTMGIDGRVQTFTSHKQAGAVIAASRTLICTPAALVDRKGKDRVLWLPETEGDLSLCDSGVLYLVSPVAINIAAGQLTIAAGEAYASYMGYAPSDIVREAEVAAAQAGPETEAEVEAEVVPA